MAKAKMFKINSVATFPNVFQNPHYTNPVLINSDGKELNLKGHWQEQIFHNANPLTLELACGKGDYSVALAERNPQRNFIGIDVKGARLFTGAKRALDTEQYNLAFARMRIENITNFFAPGEADEIWITFPDPFPRKGHAVRRLTTPSFLEKYAGICKPGAIVHLKTDDLPLFHYTLEVIAQTGKQLLYSRENIYSAPLEMDDLAIQTHYEKSHLAKGRTIHYLRFALP